MHCIYESKETEIYRSYDIKSYQDLENLSILKPNDELELFHTIPEKAVHTGTYATLDELLFDYVERFL
jgi:hypothetical protein